MTRFLSVIADDGYTEPGYIEARRGLYEELRFTFRPLLVTEQNQWSKGAGNMQPAAWDRQCAGLMAGRLKSWTLTTAKGEPLPVSAANILRLKPSLYSRLYGILLGTEPSDIDPEWSEEKKDEVAVDEAAGLDLIGGAGEEREARNEKN